VCAVARRAHARHDCGMPQWKRIFRFGKSLSLDIAVRLVAVIDSLQKQLFSGILCNT
jgi:hypothetical protein